MRKTALVLITVLVLCLLAPVGVQAAGAEQAGNDRDDLSLHGLITPFV